MSDLSPELSGLREHSGNEPELSMARPRCSACNKPMIQQGENWKCIRMACMRLRFGGQGNRTSPVYRGKLDTDPKWFVAGKTTVAEHIMRVRSGLHPTGHPLLRDNPSATCGNCMHCVANHMGNTYHKCLLDRLKWTGGPGTDIRKKWAACNRWHPEPLAALDAPE